MKALLVWSDGIGMNHRFFEDSNGRDGVELAREEMQTRYANYGTPDENISYCAGDEAVFQGDDVDACLWNVIPIPETQMDENVKNAILRGFDEDLYYQINETTNPIKHTPEICSKILALEKLGFQAEAEEYRELFSKKSGRSLDEFIAYELAETVDITEQFLKDTGFSISGYRHFTLTIRGNVWCEDSSWNYYGATESDHKITREQIQDWMDKNYPCSVNINSFFEYKYSELVTETKIPPSHLGSRLNY